MTLDLAPQGLQDLRDTAKELGFTIGRGPMAQEGSVQKMVEALVAGDLVIQPVGGFLMDPEEAQKVKEWAEAHGALNPGDEGHKVIHWVNPVPE